MKKWIVTSTIKNVSKKRNIDIKKGEILEGVNVYGATMILYNGIYIGPERIKSNIKEIE